MLVAALTHYSLFLAVSSTLLSRLSLPLLLLFLLLLTEDAILLFPPSCTPDTVIVLLILHVWHRHAAVTLSWSGCLHYVVKKMTINDVQCKRMMCLYEIGNSNIRLLSFGRFTTSMSFPESLPVCHLPRLISRIVDYYDCPYRAIISLFLFLNWSCTLNYYFSQLWV